MKGEDKARRYVNRVIVEAGRQDGVSISSIRSGKKHFVVDLESTTGGRRRLVVPHAINAESHDKKGWRQNVAEIRRMM